LTLKVVCPRCGKLGSLGIVKNGKTKNGYKRYRVSHYEKGCLTQCYIPKEQAKKLLDETTGEIKEWAKR